MQLNAIHNYNFGCETPVLPEEKVENRYMDNINDNEDHFFEYASKSKETDMKNFDSNIFSLTPMKIVSAQSNNASCEMD